MKLFYSPNSPFSRKCRLVILEKKIDGIEQVEASPADNPPELLAVNPLGTIPALVTRDGMHLCDSGVIVEYLDALPSPAPRLIPEGDARLCVLALAAMAEGMLNAAVSCVLEGRRPPQHQYPAWVERKEKAVVRAIDKIASANLDFTLPLTLGTLNLAVALHYVSFRLPGVEWRGKYPALAAWADGMAQRPSFAATAPQP